MLAVVTLSLPLQSETLTPRLLLTILESDVKRLKLKLELEFEFELPYPDGSRMGLSGDAIAAFQKRLGSSL